MNTSPFPIAKNARLQQEPTELVEWWSEAEGILECLLPPSVLLESCFPYRTWVAMTGSALTQAVSYLIKNAGDSMREQSPGRITVTARLDGQYVNLIVCDTGPGLGGWGGMSSALAPVYGPVREADGEVDVQARPGVGTTFVLRLLRVAPPGKVETETRRRNVMAGAA